MEKSLIIKEEQKEELENVYAQLDKETSKTMKQAVETMTLVTQNTKFVMGEQLSKVQEQLAGNNQYDSFFGKWFSALGLKKDFVYDCINYYKVLVANSDNQKKLENLSFSKVCEVAKIKDNIELQQKVIEIAPLKEMKVNEIKTLVEEVKEKQEVTEEMIESIIQKEDKSKTSFKNFVKVTKTFIETFENQTQEIKKEEVKEVLELIENVKDLCKISN